MEKRTPHYSLVDVKAMVARLGAAAFTKSALDGGRALGMTTTEMLQCVQTLQPSHLHKSMTTHANAAIWQDVYRGRFKEVALYIKVTLRANAPVISFKEL